MVFVNIKIFLGSDGVKKKLTQTVYLDFFILKTILFYAEIFFM